MRQSDVVVPLLAALVLLLVVSRLAGLADKLPHHDEMLHWWFSEMLAAEGTYRASPAYHGPLLYHLEAAVLGVAGSGLWQARLVPALAGIAAACGLIALAWRERGRHAALWVGALVVLSPTWLYYSRFDSHDTLILLATVVVAWGRWHWSQGRATTAVWLILPALALAWATKLNALFVAAAIGLWPVARWAILSARRPASARPRGLAWPTASVCIDVVLAICVPMSALFATTLVAALAEHSLAQALWTTLRAASIDPVTYWAGLHAEQRLPGPFHYYAALLALYEPLLLLGVVLALAGAWRAARRPRRTFTRAVLGGAALLGALWPVAPWLAATLHLHPLHAAVLPLLGVSAWLAARQRAEAGDEAGVWWLWLAVTQTLLYGYAGEKVPWLGVHVALPWMMVAGPVLATALPATRAGRGAAVRGLVAASLALTAYGAYAVTHWTASDPAEPLVQLEYARGTHAMLQALDEACRRAAPVNEACLETTADAAWPAQWYLRRVPGTPVDTRGLDAGPDTPFIFVPARRASPKARDAALERTHRPHEVRFTTWGTWVEWLHRPRVADLLRFWWQRRSLGPRRGVAYELWVRRDLDAPWATRLARETTDDQGDAVRP